MVGGNRGSRVAQPGKTVVLHVRLPPEIIMILDAYHIRIRSISVSETVRRLLETHPALTSLAESLYNEDSTSPQ